jgi:hypothetical protein
MASMAMPNPLDFPPVLKPLKLVSELMDLYGKTYTYQELVEKKYPRGIDGSKLEVRKRRRKKNKKKKEANK